MTALPSIGYSIMISILNWNTADMTLQCIDSLLAMQLPENYIAQIFVVDNGSGEDDFAKLKEGVSSRQVELHREAKNLGFAGGHNVAITRAVMGQSDFVWLMNSDALVEENTLTLLIDTMREFQECGAVSPVIVATNDVEKMDFCGNVHDWQNLTSIRALTVEEAMKLQNESPANVWVTGTAILMRTSALAQVGGLDASLFAYYEDDDICARLSKAGWLCRTVFDARIRHAVFEKHFDRPPHFHYLTNRNYLAFWYKNTPTPYRKLLWLKLVDRGFYEINRLYRRGMDTQANAGLLGIHDFIVGRSGFPDLARKTPLPTRLLRRMFAWSQSKALKATLRNQ